MMNYRNYHASLLLVMFVAGSCISEEEQGVPFYEIAVGERLPEFTVVMSDGDTVRSSDLQGTQSVIAFFNTSCGDCRRELPVLQQVYDRCVASGRDVRFLCIAREQDGASIAAYWQKNGLSLPYSPQPDRAVYALFASSNIPRIYVVSSELLISYSGQTVDEVLEAILF